MEVSRLLGGLVCFLAISDATATATAISCQAGNHAMPRRSKVLRI